MHPVHHRIILFYIPSFAQVKCKHTSCLDSPVQRRGGYAISFSHKWLGLCSHYFCTVSVMEVPVMLENNHYINWQLRVSVHSYSYFDGTLAPSRRQWHWENLSTEWLQSQWDTCLAWAAEGQCKAEIVSVLVSLFFRVEGDLPVVLKDRETSGAFQAVKRKPVSEQRPGCVTVLQYVLAHF